jgi:3-oxoacyl-[acyl-carrier-protein] synthase III
MPWWRAHERLTHLPARAAAIAGVATWGCGECPGHTDMELLVRSAHAAVADAGLKMSDIDGICTASVARPCGSCR